MSYKDEENKRKREDLLWEMMDKQVNKGEEYEFLMLFSGGKDKK